jgi:hypothetical protein
MKEKKIAAAVSAVMAYIKTEEEMATMQAVDQVQPAKPEKAPPAFTLWGSTVHHEYADHDADEIFSQIKITII